MNKRSDVRDLTLDDGNERLMLLADDPLIQTGLYYLLAEITSATISLCDLSQLRTLLLSRHCPVMRWVIVPSQPDILHVLPQLITQWPDARVALVSSSLALLRWQVLSLPPSVAVLPLQAPLPALAQQLRRALQGPRNTMCGYEERFVNPGSLDPLLVRLKSLSPMQCQVLKLLMKGIRPTQVAHLIGIKVRTVSTHKMNAMNKLGVRGSVGLHALQMHPRFCQALESMLLHRLTSR